MATFISENTDLPLPIVCYFCETGRGRRILDEPGRVAAVRLRGQWAGGEADEVPHWKPVCVEHDSTWGEGLDPRYFLPAFDLTTYWIVIERESRDMAIGPYASEEDAQLALRDSLLVEAECQEDCTGDCFVKPVDHYGDDLTTAFEVVLIDLDQPEYTGKAKESA